MPCTIEPAPLLIIATRLPRALGCMASALVTAISSSMLSTGIMPAWRNAPCTTPYEPPKKPVCDIEARAAALGASHLEHDDGLLLRDPLRGLQQLAPVLEPFDVHGDDVGLRVVRQVGQQVGLVDVGAVAVGDELADAQLGDLLEEDACRPCRTG